MRFRELDKWVGLSGTTLKRRSRALGSDYQLEDLLTVGEANRLYRLLPIDKVLTVSYKDSRKPTIDFIGSWNVNDLHRIFKKVQHGILVRNRDFLRDARRNAAPENGAVVVDKSVSDEGCSVKENTETVSNIEVAVPIDIANVIPIVEELDHAGRTSTSTRAPSGASDDTGATEPGPSPGPGRDKGRGPGLVAVGDAGTDTSGVDSSERAPGETGSENSADG